MFCTDKERDTCNVEKMGCEGCYYNSNDMEDIKEKTADEMMEDMQYCKVIDENNIYYNQLELGDTIQFDLIRQQVMAYKTETEIGTRIIMQELQAINKKCKELRLVRR